MKVRRELSHAVYIGAAFDRDPAGTPPGDSGTGNREEPGKIAFAEPEDGPNLVKGVGTDAFRHRGHAGISVT
ncbi:MAG TPA: hypothetical protein VGD01_14285 [Candidatus Elarobacter sp.]